MGIENRPTKEEAVILDNYASEEKYYRVTILKFMICITLTILGHYFSFMYVFSVPTAFFCFIIMFMMASVSVVRRCPRCHNYLNRGMISLTWLPFIYLQPFMRMKMACSSCGLLLKIRPGWKPSKW